jgi:hypothetical protein
MNMLSPPFLFCERKYHSICYQYKMYLCSKREDGIKLKPFIKQLFWFIIISYLIFNVFKLEVQNAENTNKKKKLCATFVCLVPRYVNRTHRLNSSLKLLKFCEQCMHHAHIWRKYWDLNKDHNVHEYILEIFINTFGKFKHMVACLMQWRA